jgi:hypothetical protein
VVGDLCVGMWSGDLGVGIWEFMSRGLSLWDFGQAFGTGNLDVGISD